jgi:hypothetical protein
MENGALEEGRNSHCKYLHEREFVGFLYAGIIAFFIDKVHYTDGGSAFLTATLIFCLTLFLAIDCVGRGATWLTLGDNHSGTLLLVLLETIGLMSFGLFMKGVTIGEHSKLQMAIAPEAIAFFAAFQLCVFIYNVLFTKMLGKDKLLGRVWSMILGERLEKSDLRKFFTPILDLLDRWAKGAESRRKEGGEALRDSLKAIYSIFGILLRTVGRVCIQGLSFHFLVLNLAVATIVLLRWCNIEGKALSPYRDSLLWSEAVGFFLVYFWQSSREHDAYVKKARPRNIPSCIMVVGNIAFMITVISLYSKLETQRAIIVFLSQQAIVGFALIFFHTRGQTTTEVTTMLAVKKSVSK